MHPKNLPEEAAVVNTATHTALTREKKQECCPLLFVSFVFSGFAIFSSSSLPQEISRGQDVSRCEFIHLQTVSWSRHSWTTLCMRKGSPREANLCQEKNHPSTRPRPSRSCSTQQAAYQGIACNKWVGLPTFRSRQHRQGKGNNEQSTNIRDLERTTSAREPHDSARTLHHNQLQQTLVLRCCFRRNSAHWPARTTSVQQAMA